MDIVAVASMLKQIENGHKALEQGMGLMVALLDVKSVGILRKRTAVPTMLETVSLSLMHIMGAVSTR